jgi:hypothetical protein
MPPNEPMNTDSEKARADAKPAPRGPESRERDPGAESKGMPLQQGLQALLKSERAGQEKLQHLQEQRRVSEQRDSARRVAALEEALAEARAEVAKREEVEQVLGRVRMEAAKLAIELGQAERDADEARRAAKPKADKRIDELEQASTEARAEATRERERREQLELELKAASRSERAAWDQVEKLRTVTQNERAQFEARWKRERAERGLEQERMRALEQLLEAASKPETVAGQAPSAMSPESIGPATKQAQAGRSAPEASATRRDGVEDARSSERAGNSRDAEQPSRSRRRRRIFEARGRTCAVCRRTEAASPAQLKAGGWALGAEIDLCPECQEKGWQLPVGGSLPFRRSSDRDKAS